MAGGSSLSHFFVRIASSAYRRMSEWQRLLPSSKRPVPDETKASGRAQLRLGRDLATGRAQLRLGRDLATGTASASAVQTELDPPINQIKPF